MGYQPIFTGQKTSLKMKPINDDCLASEFDNIFYHPEKTRFINSGVIHFYKSFVSLKEARMVSDHIPIWFEFSLN
jgi:deoxyribonuclease-1-like protein